MDVWYGCWRRNCGRERQAPNVQGRQCEHLVELHPIARSRLCTSVEQLAESARNAGVFAWGGKHHRGADCNRFPARNENQPPLVGWLLPFRGPLRRPTRCIWGTSNICSPHLLLLVHLSLGQGHVLLGLEVELLCPGTRVVHSRQKTGAKVEIMTTPFGDKRERDTCTLGLPAGFTTGDAHIAPRTTEVDDR